MFPLIFTVILALICANPKSFEARTEGKYIVTNADLALKVAHSHDHTLASSLFCKDVETV